jgi:aryl-alcohol dehydrogenase-like predicted oxidoreductase
VQFSRLMLGTVQFGMAYGINNQQGKPNPECIQAILRTAADNGVNVLDTARSYGDSEEQIAAALKKTGLQKHFKIITKIQVFPKDLPHGEREAWVERSLTTSLKALQRDDVEGVLIHHESELDSLPLLEKYRERGLVQFVGASLDSNQTRDIEALDATQIPGNILDRRFTEYAHRAAARGGLIFVRSVYLQGLLFKPEDQLHPVFKEKLLPVRRQLEALAREAALKPSELYFRYLLSNPDFTCILSGVDTPEQLLENISIVQKGALPKDLLRKIAAIVPELPEELIRPSSWPK